jgi:hypothetical protein
MKRMFASFLVGILTALACGAQELNLGAHAAYVLGGDLSRDTLGYGAQVISHVNKVLSLELAATTFSDDNRSVTRDVVTIAGSARLGVSPAENIGLYAGGGASYNMLGLVPPGGGRTWIDPAFGFHFCGGITVGILANLDLFAEFRGSSARFRDPDDARLAELFEGRYEYGLVTAGVLLSL